MQGAAGLLPAVAQVEEARAGVRRKRGALQAAVRAGTIKAQAQPDAAMEQAAQQVVCVRATRSTQRERTPRNAAAVRIAKVSRARAAKPLRPRMPAAVSRRFTNAAPTWIAALGASATWVAVARPCALMRVQPKLVPATKTARADIVRRKPATLWALCLAGSVRNAKASAAEPPVASPLPATPASTARRVGTARPGRRRMGTVACNAFARAPPIAPAAIASPASANQPPVTASHTRRRPELRDPAARAATGFD
jgi:hypothetical protein